MAKYDHRDWRYRAALDYAENLRILRKALRAQNWITGSALFGRFAELEAVRLGEKLRHMQHESGSL